MVLLNMPSKLLKLYLNVWTLDLFTILFNYRITPQGTTAISPVEFLMKCKLHSHLDQLIPNISAKVAKAQEQQRLIMIVRLEIDNLLWMIE